MCTHLENLDYTITNIIACWIVCLYPKHLESQIWKIGVYLGQMQQKGRLFRNFTFYFHALVYSVNKMDLII